MTEAVEQAIKDIKETCAFHKGLGLAAPQVGYDLRFFVFNTEEIIINPIIISGSSKIWSEESCLSIPGASYRVRRWKEITVAYYNEHGDIINDRVLKGIEAVVFQHEYDHLKGILIRDKEIR
jgi:peptide deformylase